MEICQRLSCLPYTNCVLGISLIGILYSEQIRAMVDTSSVFFGVTTATGFVAQWLVETSEYECRSMSSSSIVTESGPSASEIFWTP